MRNSCFSITVPHLFTPMPALSAESKTYTLITYSYNQGTLQIIQSNFLIFNNAFNKLRSKPY